MKDLSTTLQETLGKQLGAEGYDVIDVVPIPKRGDRLVRMRTLEEAIEEFDQQGDGAVGYLVHVRPKTSDEQAPDPDRPSLDGIYLPDGKLNIPFLFRNAEMLFVSGEHKAARKIYRAILASGERSALALYWLGRCFEAEGSPAEARAHYEQSIAYQPLLDTYRRLSILLVEAGKDQEAAELLELALKLKDIGKGAQFEAHKAAGNCWLRCSQTEKAEKHYLRALELDPKADTIHANLGALKMEANRLIEAKRHFQEAITLNRSNEKALVGLATCLYSDGQKQAAHDAFAAALAVNLQNPTAVFFLTKCAYELKSYGTAARLVAQYIDVAPVNANLLYSLAGLQFHLGRLMEARATGLRALQIQPQHAAAGELMKMIDRYSPHAAAKTRNVMEDGNGHGWTQRTRPDER